MKAIHVRGNQFKIGDEVRPIATRTSFCLLGHYQRGNRDTARRWLDRLKAQGWDGPRLFGENQDWFRGRSPFFGTDLTPRVDCFDAGFRGPFSGLELRAGYERDVEELAEDLMERDLIAEFCCIATIKGREPGWVGHGLNKFAQMFRRLFPDPKNTPFLHETVNELGAHTHPDLNADRREWARMGPRWRRSHDDPSHHNYPGSSIGVSANTQEDRWSPGFDDLGYTHRNLHPPRGEHWDMGRDRGEGREPVHLTLRELKKKAQGRPVYLNETVHYMTREQWDTWVEGRTPKWASLSTVAHKRLVNYLETCLNEGVSVCGHDFVGMMTDPSEPITPFEEAMSELLGGNIGPGPETPTEPEPTHNNPIAEMIRRGYAEILQRKPDEEGFKTYYNHILNGWSEARFREILLRSPEFREKFL